MLTSENERPIKRALCHMDAARNDLRMQVTHLQEFDELMKQQALRYLAEAHDRLLKILKAHAQEAQAVAGPLKAPLRAQQVAG
jgi:hypothetical protein